MERSEFNFLSILTALVVLGYVGVSAFAMLHPGLAAELDHPDVAALVAPRPFLLMGSPQDRLFPWDAAQRAAAQLAQAWPQGGFRFESTRGGHQFGAEAQAVAWALD